MKQMYNLYVLDLVTFVTEQEISCEIYLGLFLKYLINSRIKYTQGVPCKTKSK